MEETRPGEYCPVEENERGTYIFNSKDLCMIDHIPEIVEAGINSLKVEGRMKTALYVATVARAYRNAIDTYFENPEEYQNNIPVYFDEITKCTNRRFTTGFYFGKPSSEAQVYENSTYVKDFIYLGRVDELLSPNSFTLIQKNKFYVNDMIEILSPGKLDKREVKVLKITDEQGNEMESCPHAAQRLIVTLSSEVRKGDLLRVGPPEQD